MNILETYYTYAKLAQAAYIDLSQGELSVGDDPKDQDVIVDAGSSKDQQRMPEYLGKQLFGAGLNSTPDYWTILSPYHLTSPNSGHSDPDSGFAAMLLEHPVHGKVLSIAGTEPGKGKDEGSQTKWDLLDADVHDIGFLGAAFKQLVSLYNYIQVLKAPKGSTNIRRLEVHSRDYIPPFGTPYVTEFDILGGPNPITAPPTFWWLEEHHDGVPLVLDEPLLAPGEQLTVTGHSLGGHLAGMAVALFPDLFTKAYTFNAPGYNPPSSLLAQPGGADDLLDLFRQFGETPDAVSSIAGKIVTLESEDAVPGDDGDVISGTITGLPFSQETYITTEEVSHDIGHLMDSLALQSLMGRMRPLDDPLTYQQAGKILEAVTADTGITYELLFEKLYLTIVGSATRLRRTDPTLTEAGDFDVRNEYYGKIIELEKILDARTSALTIESLVDKTESELINLASTDTAYRYAIKHLNPFVILGDETIYNPHKNNGTLDLYDPVNNPNGMTPEYIADRTTMLALHLQRNITDSQVAPSVDSPFDTWDDRESGTRFTTHPSMVGVLGGSIDKALNNQYIFGSEDSDILKGGSKDDRLYGGAGSDILYGNGGNDYLEGGQGFDLYHAGNGDTLFDSDGEGMVFLENRVLTGGFRQDGDPVNLYRSDDGLVTYQLNGDTLMVSTATETLTIKNFNKENADLGIFIDDITVAGGILNLNNDDNYAPGRWEKDGEIIALFDGYDGVNGMGGNDTIFIGSHRTSFVIRGGAGDDSLFEDEQNPQGLPNSPGNGALIFGEGGKDKIFGFNRSNFLDGGEQSDYIDGGGGNDTLLGGSGGDIVIGGAGKDTAYGGEGQDELSGGAGDDRIWGGDNNDVIYGDRSSGSLLEWIDRSVWNGPDNGWQEGYYIYNSGDGFSHNILQSVMDGSNYVYNEARGAEAGNDIIFGDSGDDFIIGGEGKDYINGGIGRDLLEGEEGEDKIYGGSDDDIIYGDINLNTYANDTAVLASGNKIGDQTWAVSWRLDIAGAGYSNIYSNDPEAQIVSVSNGYVNFNTGVTFFNPSNWTLQARHTANGPAAGGNDKLYGEGGSDQLHGGIGDDILDGGDGRDIDVLIGGKDNDSYHFGRGYGIDILWDEQGDTDTIKLGEGISSKDVVLEKSGHDLLIKLIYNGSTTEDKIIVSGWYNGYQVETIEFNDGTTWTTTDIEQLSNALATPSGGTEENPILIIGGNGTDTLSGSNEADTIYAFDGDDLVTGAAGDDHLTGGSGNDELQGNDGDDTLLGDAGEDSLYGGAGNDYLHGGANSDKLIGGDGNDTYRIGRGDGFDYLDDSSGTDTVEFFGDISQSDIKLTTTEEGIDITLNDESSHLHIDGASLDGLLVIENIQFGDGTVWDADEIRQRLSHKIGTDGDDHIDAISQSDNHLEGLAGNDQLVGLSGNDLLEGGDGEDTLIGGGGDDRLIGGLGSDNYIVGDQDQTGHVIIEDNGQPGESNILKFEPGIIPSQLSAQQINDDLLISWGVVDSDTTVKGYFLDPQAWQFELSSGASLDVDRLINPRLVISDALVLENSWMDFMEISYAELVAKAEERKTSRYGIDSPLNHNVELIYNSNNSQQSNFKLIQTEEGWYVLTTPGSTSTGLSSWGFERSYPQGRGDGEVKVTDFDLKTLGQFTPLRASTYNMNYHDGELVLSPRLIDTPYTYSQYNTQYTTITRLATDILYGDEIGSGSGLMVSVPIGLSTYNLQRIFGTEESDIVDIPASGPIFPAPAMIDGHEGDDQLIGDDADDMIYGSEGDDYIVGGYGDDHLAGGAGSDTLRGGMGSDTYYAGFDHAGIDLIEDDGLFVNAVIDYLIQYGLPENIKSEYPDFIGNEEEEGEGEGSSFNQEIVMEYLKNASEDEMAGIISQMQNDGWGWEVPSMINDVVKINADLSDTSLSWTVEEGGGRLLLNIKPKDTSDRGIVVSLRQLGRDVLGYGVELFEFNDGVISRDELIQMMPTPMQGDEGDDLLRGGDGDDLLIGGWGNDRLLGKEGNDVLFGGEDDDRLNGGVGADSLTGGIGADWLSGGEGDDTLDGGSDNDRLYGEGGNDLLLGGEGNDRLNGGIGADNMSGGIGDDTYSVDDIGDTVTELADEGLDRIYSSIDYQLGANQEQLTLTGTGYLSGTGNALDNRLEGNTGNNLLIGGEGNDVLTGKEGDDSLSGDAGNDKLYGGAGNDLLDAGSGDDYLFGNEGNDTLMGGAGADFMKGGEDNDTLDGGADNDRLYGEDGNDLLSGGEGNDNLNGGSGSDSLTGGAGNDTYSVDDLGDTVTELADEGLDRIYSSIDYQLGDNQEQLTLTGAAHLSGTGNALDNRLEGNTGNNHLVGGEGNDSLTGKEGDDTLMSDAGNDRLYGGAGNDLLDAGAGDDYLFGGEGNDTLMGGPGADFMKGGEGDDTLDGGADNDRLYGEGGNDLLTGGEGNDRLNGGAGADSMAGGAGNDTYTVDDLSDTVTELADEGLDRIYSSIDYQLGDNQEQLTLTGAAHLSGTGNALDNRLEGNTGNNLLIGGEGNDVLTGKEGDDSLSGDAGNDRLYGGAGNDLLDAGAGNDYLFDGEGNDTLMGGAGVDYMKAGEGDDTLDGGADNDRLYGEGGNDLLTGGEGNDRLNGGAGADSMAGGAGNDTYTVDDLSDTVTELADEGLDRIYSSIDYQLGDNQEQLTLTGAAHLSGTGNALDNRLEGNTGNNLLIGGEGNDVLTGKEGDDSLSADAGNDKLYGGEGNDLLDAGAGDDYLFGSEGSDTLIGGNGVDWLSGDEGDDILIGGTGNDQLRGGVGSDIYHIARGDGGDRITDLGGQDRVLFDGSIAHDQLWFSKSGDSLKVSLIGTDNHIQISSWFSNMESYVEVFETDNGQFLYDQQVQQLVDAMAAFAPPASGQLNLTDEYKISLEPVIAASWLNS